VIVREETPRDGPAVVRVVTAAFDRPDEANVVLDLQREGAVLLSLVAEVDRTVVGHVLFSRMWIDVGTTLVDAVALAPLSVVPEQQGIGVGTALVERGLEGLRALRERIVIVVGHPSYYPRFGFSTAAADALEAPFPREVFMALALVPGALSGVRGRVVYPAAFGVGS
jgi:putative acetyltransferase